MSYPCTGCGACCRRVGAVLAAPALPDSPLARAIAGFPYAAREDGSCEQLTVEGQCAVYEDRPLLCRVDAMREQANVPERWYYALSAAACNAMQEQDGLPTRYRVILPTLPTDA